MRLQHLDNGEVKVTVYPKDCHNMIIDSADFLFYREGGVKVVTLPDYGVLSRDIMNQVEDMAKA